MTQNQHSKRTKNLLFFSIALSFFMTGLLSAQNPLKMGWDKTNCQANNTSEILFDAIDETMPCIIVCANDSVTYSIWGDDVENIASILWTVVGGEALYPEETSTLIRWDGSANGSITLNITLTDGTVINKIICIQKENSSLILNWDKVGCQENENRVCEVKFDDNIAGLCPKVCRGSEVTYGINGSDAVNISTVDWSVTGGQQLSADNKSVLVKWDSTPNGLINIHIVMNSGNIIDRSLCIQKIQSTLLFSWNKMECQLADSKLSEFNSIRTSFMPNAF